MSFQKKEIEAKFIAVVDFWTYKIRAGICKILNKEVKLIWYWEKRQEISDVALLEIKNLERVCKNIKIAIEKAETDAKIKVNEIIINILSSNIFIESNKISYFRKNTKEIDKAEMYEIFKDLEKKAFINSYRKIKNQSGYSKNDLKLLINNISNLKLDDDFFWKDIIGTNPKEISANILNIFITENKDNLNKIIGNYIKKEISYIIPTEYALLSLFNDNKSIVIIDLGNSHISVIVKKDNYILWVKKLSFWINDLIKRIREEYNIPRSEIIKNIDTNNYLPEKKEFLEIFKDIIAITLEDILKWEVCPSNFFVSWWGANKFLKDYLENLNFNKYNLKIAKKISYVTPKIDFIDNNKVKENIEWSDSMKTNINIYAMIKTSLEFIKKEKNSFEQFIKQIVKELWND